MNPFPRIMSPSMGLLQALKRKAEERNPDEFYFAMEKARTVEGVHDGRCEAPI